MSSSFSYRPVSLESLSLYTFTQFSSWPAEDGLSLPRDENDDQCTNGISS